MNEQIERDVVRQAALLDISLWAIASVFYGAPSVALGHMTPKLAAFLVVCSGLGAAVCWGLFRLIWRTRGLRRGARLALIALATAAAVVAHAIADTASFGALFGLRPAEDGALLAPMAFATLSNAVMMVWVYVLFVAGVALSLSAATTRERERSLAAARSAIQEAQLEALRLQVNPHFLFNVLNAVGTLIETNRNAQAEAMVARLSDFFRASLTSGPGAEATLEDELDVIDSYLEIEGVRFGSRLIVDIDCPDDLREALVPHFLLQPLVDNAIKHGVARTTRPVTLSVRAFTRNGVLVMQVADDAAADGAPPADGAGVGQGNVASRLKALFGDAGRLRTIVGEGAYMVEIEMPLAFAEERLRAA